MKEFKIDILRKYLVNVNYSNKGAENLLFQGRSTSAPTEIFCPDILQFFQILIEIDRI
jgi:hypothetical protein